MKTKIKNLLPLLLLLGLPGVVQAQDAYSTNADGSIYTYSTNADGSASIVAYAGPPWVVTIPTNINGLTITTIGYGAFYGTALTSVTIPNSVVSIGDFAFDYCTSLTNVIIGNSVISIGDEAFGDCTSLRSINADASNPAYSSTNGVLFDKAQATLLQFPAGLSGGYTIPNTVTSIGYEAFESCSSLTNVTIGNSVTNIGVDAFYDCGITSVTIPNSITTIGDEAFYGCFHLMSVTIPNSVTSIGFDAFEESGIISLTIPNSVTNIGQGAFNGCFYLTSVTIGNSVTNIGQGAFASCNSLTNVTIPGSVTNIGQSAFAYCSDLTSVTIGNSVTSIGEEAFNECTSLTNVTIPGSVTSIGEEAFLRCASLRSVIIPNSVTSIGQSAFAGCDGLTSVYFTGNAPSPTNDSSVFYGNYYDPATIYYLPGTTGWGAMFDGLPTAPWFLPNPVILNNGPGFGVQPGGFGFTISWATNASVVVQAATNLVNPVWMPVSTNPLTNGTSYFSDPQWTNYPERFYRATSAFTVGGTLTGLHAAGDTVVLQDNGGDDLTLTTNGAFTFPTALPNGQSYSVTVSGTNGTPDTKTTAAVTANGSGTISGANVTNVTVFCHTGQMFTGDLDVDMYNAAVLDGTAHGGVPGVMLTQNGGPYRVTADGLFSNDVCREYSTECVFTLIVGTDSCSSTTLPSGGNCIQFGTVLECGFGPYGY